VKPRRSGVDVAVCGVSGVVSGAAAGTGSGLGSRVGTGFGAGVGFIVGKGIDDVTSGFGFAASDRDVRTVGLGVVTRDTGRVTTPASATRVELGGGGVEDAGVVTGTDSLIGLVSGSFCSAGIWSSSFLTGAVTASTGVATKSSGSAVTVWSTNEEIATRHNARIATKRITSAYSSTSAVSLAALNQFRDAFMIYHRIQAVAAADAARWRTG
jgi:hypothetical protein